MFLASVMCYSVFIPIVVAVFSGSKSDFQEVRLSTYFGCDFLIGMFSECAAYIETETFLTGFIPPGL